MQIQCLYWCDFRCRPKCSQQKILIIRQQKELVSKYFSWKASVWLLVCTVVLCLVPISAPGFCNIFFSGCLVFFVCFFTCRHLNWVTVILLLLFSVVSSIVFQFNQEEFVCIRCLQDWGGRWQLSRNRLVSAIHAYCLSFTAWMLFAVLLLVTKQAE